MFVGPPNTDPHKLFGRLGDISKSYQKQKPSWRFNPFIFSPKMWSSNLAKLDLLRNLYRFADCFLCLEKHDTNIPPPNAGEIFHGFNFYPMVPSNPQQNHLQQPKVIIIPIYPGIPTTIKTMGVKWCQYNHHCLRKGFNHPNWVNHYFNGGGSPGYIYIYICANGSHGRIRKKSRSTSSHQGSKNSS